MRNITKLLTLLLTGALASPTMAQQSITGDLPPYPQVEMETSAGTIRMELFRDKAPLHVRNFVRLVEAGFYDGTIFHRVVGGFVIQGGGYDTEYKLKPTEKLIPNESGNGLSNRRGTIGMARTGDPHSADSQFYINLVDNFMLDPQPTRWGYTVFGKLTTGIELMDEIGYVATGPGPTPALSQDVPKEQIVIVTARMLEEAPLEDDSGVE